MANNFISRWSKRKFSDEESELLLDGNNTVPSKKEASLVNVSESVTEQHIVDGTEVLPVALEEQANQIDDVKDSANPSIASMLLSDVDPLIKKAALRKLFMSEEFNQVDALNDYDHDYSSVKSLSSEVAQSLREWVNDHESVEDGEQEVKEESYSSSHEDQQGDIDLSKSESENDISTELNLEHGSNVETEIPSNSNHT